MKRTSVVLLALVSAPALFADAPQRLIPAGSLISCTISEPRLSSKTEKVGDPVLCQVAHTSRYGHALMPWHSYLVGRFEEFKDPGHFVGKGFMELRFDRMVIEPDMELPVEARVVDVPGFHIDSNGRIMGKGHATRDTIEWLIPVLWPIDLIELPRRGPKPTLKEETRVTLKVMDDIEVPINNGPLKDNYGLSHREPTAYERTPEPPVREPEPMPQMSQQQAPPQQMYAPPQQMYAPPQPQYAAYPPPPPPVQYVYAPAPQYVYVPPPAPVVVMAPQPVYAYAPPLVVAVRPQVMYAPPPPVYGYGYATPNVSRVYPPVRNYGYNGVRMSSVARPPIGQQPYYASVRGQ
jgi:hypothetical protein